MKTNLFEHYKSRLVSKPILLIKKKVIFVFISKFYFLFFYLSLFCGASVCEFIKNYIHSNCYRNIDFNTFASCYCCFVNAIFLVFCCGVAALFYFGSKSYDIPLRVTSYHMTIIYLIDFFFYSIVLFLGQERFVLHTNLFSVELVWVGRLIELILMIAMLLFFYRQNFLFIKNIYTTYFRIEYIIIFTYICLVVLYFFIKSTTIDFLHELINLIYIWWLFKVKK
jgi:hypothetical protein